MEKLGYKAEMALVMLQKLRFPMWAGLQLLVTSMAPSQY